MHKKVPKKGNLKMAENNAFKSAKNSKLLSKVHFKMIYNVEYDFKKRIEIRKYYITRI